MWLIKCKCQFIGFFFILFSNKKEMDGWISMIQILVLTYQGLYKNHSFITRSNWDWIHINETSIEFGSQSSFWINIKTKTKQKNTQTNKEKTKQNVKNKTQIIIHTVTFRGIVNVEKIYCDFFSCDFFFYLSCDFLSCNFFPVYHLCIVYIISHLLEEMYENQISIWLKFHLLSWKTIICISDFW